MIASRTYFYFFYSTIENGIITSTQQFDKRIKKEIYTYIYEKEGNKKIPYYNNIITI